MVGYRVSSDLFFPHTLFEVQGSTYEEAAHQVFTRLKDLIPVRGGILIEALEDNSGVNHLAIFNDDSILPEGMDRRSLGLMDIKS